MYSTCVPPPTTPWGRDDYYSHFTDEETETQRGRQLRSASPGPGPLKTRGLDCGVRAVAVTEVLGRACPQLGGGGLMEAE